MSTINSFNLWVVIVWFSQIHGDKKCLACHPFLMSEGTFLKGPSSSQLGLKLIKTAISLDKMWKVRWEGINRVIKGITNDAASHVCLDVNCVLRLSACLFAYIKEKEETKQQWKKMGIQNEGHKRVRKDKEKLKSVTIQYLECLEHHCFFVCTMNFLSFSNT